MADSQGRLCIALYGVMVDDKEMSTAEYDSETFYTLDWAFLIWPRKGKSPSHRIRVKMQADKPVVEEEEGVDGESDVNFLVCLYLGIVKNKRILLVMLKCVEVPLAGDGPFSSRAWVKAAVERVSLDQSLVLAKKIRWSSIAKAERKFPKREIESANKKEKRALVVQM